MLLLLLLKNCPAPFWPARTLSPYQSRCSISQQQQRAGEALAINKDFALYIGLDCTNCSSSSSNSN